MAKGSIRKFRHHEGGRDNQKVYSKKPKHFTKKAHYVRLSEDMDSYDFR